MNLRSIAALVLVCAFMVLCAGSARAEPFRGDGTAKTSETKRKTIASARDRAIVRARQAALKKAITGLSTGASGKTTRELLRAYKTWASAYKVVTESVNGDAVNVQVEVEVDLGRLEKRLNPRPATTGTPLFRLAKLDLRGPCGIEEASVTAELGGMGALGSGAKEGVTVVAVCEPIGPVEHTLIEAAKVEIRASTAEGEVGRATSFGFGPDAAAATGVAFGKALGELSNSLGGHRRGRLLVRVESPLPSARVRRLEKAMRSSVPGVRDTEVAAIEPGGVVVLRIEGSVTAQGLSRRLKTLSLPGFSLRIASVDGPDALTVRLE